MGELQGGPIQAAGASQEAQPAVQQINGPLIRGGIAGHRNHTAHVGLVSPRPIGAGNAIVVEDVHVEDGRRVVHILNLAGHDGHTIFELGQGQASPRGHEKPVIGPIPVNVKQRNGSIRPRAHGRGGRAHGAALNIFRDAAGNISTRSALGVVALRRQFIETLHRIRLAQRRVKRNVFVARVAHGKRESCSTHRIGRALGRDAPVAANLKDVGSSSRGFKFHDGRRSARNVVIVGCNERIPRVRATQPDLEVGVVIGLTTSRHGHRATGGRLKAVPDVMGDGHIVRQWPSRKATRSADVAVGSVSQRHRNGVSTHVVGRGGGSRSQSTSEGDEEGK